MKLKKLKSNKAKYKLILTREELTIIDRHLQDTTEEVDKMLHGEDFEKFFDLAGDLHQAVYYT